MSCYLFPCAPVKLAAINKNVWRRPKHRRSPHPRGRKRTSNTNERDGVRCPSCNGSVLRGDAGDGHGGGSGRRPQGNPAIAATQPMAAQAITHAQAGREVDSAWAQAGAAVTQAQAGREVDAVRAQAGLGPRGSVFAAGPARAGKTEKPGGRGTAAGRLSEGERGSSGSAERGGDGRLDERAGDGGCPLCGARRPAFSAGYVGEERESREEDTATEEPRNEESPPF